MSRAQLAMALLGSALVALLPLALVAWMTSGAWSPGHVKFVYFALLLPLLGAMQFGLERVPGLVACFVTYWAIAFVLFAFYIKRTDFEVRPKRGEGSEV